MVENLHTADIHMLLDPNDLSGTFSSINLGYTTEAAEHPIDTGSNGCRNGDCLSVLRSAGNPAQRVLIQRHVNKLIDRGAG